MRLQKWTTDKNTVVEGAIFINMRRDMTDQSSRNENDKDE